MSSSYKDYVVPMRSNTLSTWLETIIITLAAMLLGYLYSPADPLLVKTDFPWMIFAPLLVSLRYGFLPGLLSASLILAGLLISNLVLQESLSTSYLVGMLLVTFLAGEFRDTWHKKITALHVANEYRQYRLDDFTRSYRLLKVSHDDLELRIAGSSRSLRSALLLLRRSLQNANTTQKQDLSAIAEDAMQVFSQYGAFTAAGLYSFDREEKLNLSPLVTLGDMPQLVLDDVLLTACLKTRHTVSIRDELLSNGANPSKLQVCVPLIDTESKLVGVLAIAQIPFFSMTDQTLNLLTLLAGYIADMLQSDSKFIKLNNLRSQQFSQHLQRATLNTKKYNLSAAILAFEFNEDNSELRNLLEQSQRGLDLQIELVNNRENFLLLVLLPLTSDQGFEKYLERINGLVKQEHPDMDLEKFNVSVRKLQLDQANAEDLNKFIYQECSLNEQQLVI